MPARTAIRTQSVPALERTFHLLELLAKSKNGLTLAEIVGKSGFPKSSTHCLLLTLQRNGYLFRNERTSRYMFGLKFFGLMNEAVGGLQLRDRAAPYLRALCQQTRRTVHLAILEQYGAVLVAKFEVPELPRLATWTGKRMDVHCTGLGKALIAHLPEEVLDRLIAEHGLPRHNENTIASPRRLKEDLAAVVSLGYSTDDEEDEIGLRCVGAPIFNSDHRVVAALSVAGTTAQIDRDNLPELSARVRQTALEISRAIGTSVV